MKYLAILSAAALLAACSQSPESAAPPEGGASFGPFSAATPAKAEARKVEISNDEMEFDYSYPAEAAAIPALKAEFDADLAKLQEETKQGTLQERKDAKQGGWEPRVYASSTAWAVVTEIPGWLSLSADRYEFTGGAHGNPWFDALLWDKTANVRRNPLDLFISKAALSAAIRPSFCDQIDKQREEKREEPVVRNADDFFSDCIDPVESTVILGSSDKQRFDRIGVLVGPYAAGPYVEGSYEATMPVTPAVLKAVKPEYRQFFALKK